MLKILQISNKSPYPPNDGSSIAIYNMAQGLIDNGAQLYLLAVNTKKHFKNDAEVPEDFKKNSHYTSVYQNTDTSAFGALANLFSSGSYFVSRFYFPEFENKLIEVLKQNIFDVIQIEGVFMAVYLDVMRKYSKAKIVLRAHNVEHLIWERHLKNSKKSILNSYLSIQNKRLKKFEIEVIDRIDAIVTITDYDKLLFEGLGFKKSIFTCITGVDVAQYQTKQNLQLKPRTVFYFGSMDWMPNQEAVKWFLDNCWQKISKAVPDAKFVIAGRGMPQSFLKLNLPNVLVIENVKDGKAFFEQHKIMVVPLLSGSGLRIKIIEGMAYGKPIVSTSIGAEGIYCDPNEDIIVADQPDDFSKAVIELLNDPAKRERLEKRASAFAYKEFDNKNVVSKLVQFYNTLLNA
ncbi:MAG: glycosyltransferase family 4 protein [Bacteroidetes bacterium]|nr:glycosyltransferase family 4 protein [Bacteroidota bacterium]